MTGQQAESEEHSLYACFPSRPENRGWYGAQSALLGPWMPLEEW